jgi:hypothetical protein
MYIIAVTFLMVILPIISVITEIHLSTHHYSLIVLIGKWFVFWGVGMRLFTAGIRQVSKPNLTAERIFEIHDKNAFILVQELGFATISIGILGICSLFIPNWLTAAAITGGLFYGLAGVRHIFKKSKNFEEKIATYSDLFMFLVMLIYCLAGIK